MSTPQYAFGSQWGVEPAPADPSRWPDLEFLDAGYDTPIWGEPSFTGVLARAAEHCPGAQLARVTLGDLTVGVYGFLPFPQEGPSALETLICLHPDARGTGIARALVAGSVVAASVTGALLYADVRSDNVRSIRFHQGLLAGTASTRHVSPLGYSVRRWLLTGAVVPAESTSGPLVAALTDMLDDAALDSPLGD